MFQLCSFNNKSSFKIEGVCGQMCGFNNKTSFKKQSYHWLPSATTKSNATLTCTHKYVSVHIININEQTVLK